MNKICGWCGSEFHPKHGNSKYCSDECRNYAIQESWRKASLKYVQKKYRAPTPGTGKLKLNRESDFEKEKEDIWLELKGLGLR